MCLIVIQWEIDGTVTQFQKTFSEKFEACPFPTASPSLLSFCCLELELDGLNTNDYLGP